MAQRVLIVDDDRSLLALLESELRQEGYDVATLASGRDILATIVRIRPAVLILDLGLPDRPGAEILREVHAEAPDLPVVILTADDEVESVVDCMRSGAFDFVTKPFDRIRLLAAVNNATARGALEQENRQLRAELRREGGFGRLLGQSEALGSSVALLRRAAKSDITILIGGESGTGKELAARAAHAESSRCAAGFVAVNCGAIPDSLIESELFGHEKGAFTGASATRRGCFEEADGGTLFLDEIGELRPDVQVRLLRVLQEGELQRVGSSKTIRVDTRIVAATNLDLRAEVEAGRFREDLYYRLAVFPVVLPPLRDRGEDTLLLAHSFLEQAAERFGNRVARFSNDAAEALRRHPWPGNVRELSNVVERAAILADGPTIFLEQLPPDVVASVHPDGIPDSVRSAERTESTAAIAVPDAPEVPDSQADPRPAGSAELAPGAPVGRWEDYERDILRHALTAANWNVTLAASQLGIGRATLYRKIDRYDLRADSA